MRVFDCFTFCNELDLLEVRLHELADVVDYFVLVEASSTFTRKPKPLHFSDSLDRFSEFLPKIRHIEIADFPHDLEPGMPCERFQRNQISLGLADASPDDLIMVSDVDAIPSASSIASVLQRRDYSEAVIFYEMPVYHLKLNWRTKRRKRRFETRIIENRNFRSGQQMHDLRPIVSRSIPASIESVAWNLRAFVKYGHPVRRVIIQDEGWHFSFMFDNVGVREKIRAYSHFDREVGENMSDPSLDARRTERQSMFGDPISLESLEALPAYVRKNVDRFASMLDLSNQASASAFADSGETSVKA